MKIKFKEMLNNKFTQYEKFTKDNILSEYEDLYKIMFDLDELSYYKHGKRLFFNEKEIADKNEITAHLNYVLNFILDKDNYINIDLLLNRQCYHISDILTNMLAGRYVGIGPGELFVSFFIYHSYVHGATIANESECLSLESMSYDIDTKYYGKFEIKMIDSNNEIRLGGIGTPSNYTINAYLIKMLKKIDELLQDDESIKMLYELNLVKSSNRQYNNIFKDLKNEFYNANKKNNKNLTDITLYDKYIHGEFSKNDFNKLNNILDITNNLSQMITNAPYRKYKNVNENNVEYKYFVGVSNKNVYSFIETTNNVFRLIEIVDNIRYLQTKLINLAHIKSKIENELSQHLKIIPILALKNIANGEIQIPNDCFIGIFDRLPFKRLTTNKFKFCVDLCGTMP